MERDSEAWSLEIEKETLNYAKSICRFFLPVFRMIGCGFIKAFRCWMVVGSVGLLGGLHASELLPLLLDERLGCSFGSLIRLLLNAG